MSRSKKDISQMYYSQDKVQFPLTSLFANIFIYQENG